jgi:hypothetical protein
LFQFLVYAGMVASKDAHTHHRNGNRIVSFQEGSQPAGCQREQQIVNVKPEKSICRSLSDFTIGRSRD